MVRSAPRASAWAAASKGCGRRACWSSRCIWRCRPPSGWPRSSSCASALR
jgi:hypothetical protein